MIIDGNALARELYKKIAAHVSVLDKTPTLYAIACAPNFETKKYLELKKRKALSVGITLNVLELPETSTTEEIVQHITTLVHDCHGIVVQLPLPAHIDRETVLAAIPIEKDPDGFAYGHVDGACIPPVVAAIDTIARKYTIEWEGKKVVVLGHGRLVGQPAAHFAKVKGGIVDVITLETSPAESMSAVADADILITGIGQPHFITVDMVKSDVVIFDAGTSEDSGELRGDVHPNVATHVALFTPVPGGIGPLTVAHLLQNLVILARQ